MKKLLVTVLVVALASTGCSKLPGAAGSEVERTVKVNRQAPAARATAEPARTSAPSMLVSHQPAPSRKTAPTPAAVTLKATTQVLEAPTAEYRAYPIITPQGDVLDTRISPANGQATWRVATDGEAPLAKVLVTYTVPGEAPQEMAATPAELKWPSTLTGDQRLTFPVACYALASYLKAHPDAHDMTIHLSCQAPDGEALLDLSLPVTVL